MMVPFFDAVQSHLSQSGEWQEELVLFVQGWQEDSAYTRHDAVVRGRRATGAGHRGR